MTYGAKDVWSLGRTSRARDAQCDFISELRSDFSLSRCVSKMRHHVVRSVGGKVTKEKFQRLDLGLLPTPTMLHRPYRYKTNSIGISISQA